ncbi:hypothetical protein TTHERM_000122388 (macronuclear) [Tetrahymena thermophila SB210]|uniref:Transmembrane protein n=1 Tax=Tetrahymena thermophila (strain SB210) TaxID=312017 RepID=W7XL75_TETTS|nr:hypothetical protein TTHERM_000122388 [Tetrahymena thermophila SB210]EWS75799.1 hypothetical protein TTHERM_000122388 [Tetrahymena thermophila SB210]|eukprot:XP_012651721.1 hypothetical protein TTHERM_000122388 [Tetrahymena thermophila SB210]
MIQQIKQYEVLEEFINSSLLSHQVLHINLTDNQIGDMGVSGLGSALKNCINLSNLTLDLQQNQIGEEGTSCLGSALTNCNNLSNLTLNLGDNQIGDRRIEKLAHINALRIHLKIYFYYIYINNFYLFLGIFIIINFQQFNQYLIFEYLIYTLFPLFLINSRTIWQFNNLFLKVFLNW